MKETLLENPEAKTNKQHLPSEAAGNAYKQSKRW